MTVEPGSEADDREEERMAYMSTPIRGKTCHGNPLSRLHGEKRAASSSLHATSTAQRAQNKWNRIV